MFIKTLTVWVFYSVFSNRFLKKSLGNIIQTKRVASNPNTQKCVVGLTAWLSACLSGCLSLCTCVCMYYRCVNIIQIDVRFYNCFHARLQRYIITVTGCMTICMSVCLLYTQKLLIRLDHKCIHPMKWQLKLSRQILTKLYPTSMISVLRQTLHPSARQIVRR